MKILLVSELILRPMIGGLAKHCITLGNHLLRVGHNVSLMGDSEFAMPKYLEMAAFNGEFILGFKLNRRLAGRIERHIGVYPYPIYKHFARQIANAINKIAKNYDVIHYHGHYPTVANLIHSEINFVQTCHDHGTFCPNKYFFRDSSYSVCSSFSPEDCAVCFNSKRGLLQYWFTKKGCVEWRAATIEAVSKHKTIFVSERILNIALKVLGLAKAPTISVIHNFIDTEEILSKIGKRNKHEELSHAIDNRVLFASVLNPAKGVLSFLRVYKKRKCYFPVTIIGSGSGLPSMQEEFKAYPVRFLGWLPHEEVLNQMVSHNAFVVSSLGEEPCPTTALEAMFLNKRVFALKRGGILELKAYERYKDQVKLYDTMEELVNGVVETISNHYVPDNADILDGDFGACISKKAMEIIKVYNQ